MTLRDQIKEQGRTLVWVAKQIDCNYQSFKVYMNYPHLMPEHVEKSVKRLLNIK